MTRRRQRSPMSGLPIDEVIRHRKRAEYEVRRAQKANDSAQEAQANVWLDQIWTEIRRRDTAGVNRPSANEQSAAVPAEPTAIELAFQKAQQ